jgi:hypothetical protein
VLDGDGWDDVNLIYHYRVESISGRTGVRLNDALFDVYADWTYDPNNPSTPNYTPIGFHSGRNYGSHSALTGHDGSNNLVERTVMVAGSPVGTFSGVGAAFCNVSRWVGALESAPGQPSTRKLKWADYYGFTDNDFPSTSSCTVDRPGDFVNNCIHRFSDSTCVMDGTEVLAFNYFTQTSPPNWGSYSNSCVNEQCEYNQHQSLFNQPCQQNSDCGTPGWTCASGVCAPTDWENCLLLDLTTSGRWGFSVRRQTDGVTLTGSLDTYVWGRSNQIMPNREWVYFPQWLSSPVLFNDPATAPLRKLGAYALVNGLWTLRGMLPVCGRPWLTLSPHGTSGRSAVIGDAGDIADLTLQDVDLDGNMDLEMQIDNADPPNCEWVGYSTQTSGFVIKSGGSFQCH